MYIQGVIGELEFITTEHVPSGLQQQNQQHRGVTEKPRNSHVWSDMAAMNRGLSPEDTTVGEDSPELFRCVWSGCEKVFLTDKFLQKHEESTHLKSEYDMRANNDQESYTYSDGTSSIRTVQAANVANTVHHLSDTQDSFQCSFPGCAITKRHRHRPITDNEGCYPCQFPGCEKTFRHDTNARRHERMSHLFYRSGQKTAALISQFPKDTP